MGNGLESNEEDKDPKSWRVDTTFHSLFAAFCEE